MREIVIGERGDISSAGATPVEAPSVAQIIVTGVQPQLPDFAERPNDGFVLRSPEEGRAAEVTLEVRAVLLTLHH